MTIEPGSAIAVGLVRVDRSIKLHLPFIGRSASDLERFMTRTQTPRMFDTTPN
jgi:hypothetical protein